MRNFGRSKEIDDFTSTEARAAGDVVRNAGLRSDGELVQAVSETAADTFEFRAEGGSGPTVEIHGKLEQILQADNEIIDEVADIPPPFLDVNGDGSDTAQIPPEDVVMADVLIAPAANCDSSDNSDVFHWI